jgi:SAM-dependent methyltransferase
VSEERACPVCGGRAYTAFADQRIDTGKLGALSYASRKPPEFMCLRLVRCCDCDLVYAPAPPAADFLAEAYAGAAYDSGAEAQAAARSYARALAPHLVGLRQRGAAIDVGAGSGPLLPWLAAQGFGPVVGIEPSRAAIEAATPEARPMLREGMFSLAALADLRPSLVCSFMTLEHLADPAAFVRDAHALLAPGGMLTVVVHDWRGTVNRLLGLRSPIIDLEHLQLFSRRSLLGILQRNGFESIKLQAIWNRYPLHYWLRLMPLPAAMKQAVVGSMERIGVADREISLPVGNILAVGIKAAQT